MDFFSYLLGKNMASSGGGGGGSNYGWTLIKKEELTYSTTSTSAITATTLTCDKDKVYTKDKIIVVKIIDKAGPRNGYFLGSYSFCINQRKANGGTDVYNSGTFINICLRYSGGKYYNPNSSYGLYVGTVDREGNIPITAKYNSSNSGTIDGTYIIEVYALDFPNGEPIFS